MRIARRYWPHFACGLAALTLIACSGMRTVYLDNGQKGYLISCRGLLNRWETCLVKAGQVCRSSGYETVRDDEFDRSLLIACKSGPTTANVTQ